MTHLKIYRSILAGVCLLVIIAVIAAFHYNQTQLSQKSQESIPQSTQVSYFLREYDGKIGVFQGETTLPFEILDVYVSNLPSVDQMELRSGIEILTKEELSAKIEDYGS